MTNGQFFGGLMLLLLFGCVYVRLEATYGRRFACTVLATIAAGLAWIVVAFWLIAEGS